MSLIGALPGADGGDDAPCFERRLGAATGATMSGVGFGVRGIVPIAQRTIDTAGWRTAYLVLAALALLTPVAVLALVRDRPEEVGQLSDGRASGTDLDPAGVAGSVVSRRSPQDGWSLPRAARTWRFWLMLAAFAAMYFTSQAVFVLQVALLTDVGSSALFAASVAGLIGGARVIGKLERPLRSSRT